jgi:hypothetical protein
MKPRVNPILVVLVILMTAVFSRVIAGSDFSSCLVEYVAQTFYYCPYNNYQFRRPPYNAYPYNYPQYRIPTPYPYFQKLYPCPCDPAPMSELLLFE